MLGAQHCDAVDIDSQALDASMDNAQQNHVAGSLSVMKPEQLPKQDYDIVLANILAGPLVELAPQLAGHTKVGGDIILSGILESQANNILNAYRPWFDLEEPVMQDEWVRISGRKK